MHVSFWVACIWSFFATSPFKYVQCYQWDYFSVWYVTTLKPQTGKFDFFLWITKYSVCCPLTIYPFNDYVFSIWFVHSTTLGAEKVMLSKMYVIVAFYTFNLVGQTIIQAVMGKAQVSHKSLVSHRAFPKCWGSSHRRGLISLLHAL